MTGLATWGQAVQRIDAGVNVFGTPIDVFEAPFLGGVSIIEAPLLKPFTAICLTSSRGPDADEAERVLEPPRLARRRLRRRLDRRGRDRGRQPGPPRLGRRDHGVLGDLIVDGPNRPAAGGASGSSGPEPPGRPGDSSDRSRGDIPVAKYSFPGSPAFLEAAATQVGHPEAAGPARQIATLAALANLCARPATPPPNTSRRSWPRPPSSGTSFTWPSSPPSSCWPMSPPRGPADFGGDDTRNGRADANRAGPSDLGKGREPGPSDSRPAEAKATRSSGTGAIHGPRLGAVETIMSNSITPSRPTKTSPFARRPTSLSSAPGTRVGLGLRRGLLAADPWTLTSPSVDFQANGVVAGPGRPAHQARDAFRPPGEALVVASVAPGAVTLRRKGQPPGVGQPPAPSGGLQNVEFLVATLGPQIALASYDLDRRYGIDDLIAGRRSCDLYDPREVREATVLTVLYRQYLDMSRGSEERPDMFARRPRSIRAGTPRVARQGRPPLAADRRPGRPGVRRHPLQHPDRTVTWNLLITIYSNGGAGRARRLLDPDRDHGPA